MYGGMADQSDEEDDETTTRSTARKSASAQRTPADRTEPASEPAAVIRSASPKNLPVQAPSASLSANISDGAARLATGSSVPEIAPALSPRQWPKPPPTGTTAVTTSKPTAIRVPLPPEYRGGHVVEDTNEKGHLSIACHLFPRLSETNLQFHDISWNYEQFQDGSRRAILRKRMVKVCTLLRIASIRYERRGANAPPPSPNTIFDVTLCLVDGRPHADNQIVSNLHNVVIPLQTARLGFLAKPCCTVVVRSNYAQPEVRLRITVRRRDAASASGTSTMAEADERPALGSVELALLDDSQRPAWRANAPPRSHIFGEFRMNFELAEFSTRQTQMQADYLPDVLICDECWVGVLACYRQMTCQIIAHNRENPPHSALISDLVLATFPRMLENRALADAFVRLLAKERVLTSGGDLVAGSQPISAQNIEKFRQLYQNYILPLVLSVVERRDTALIQRIIDQATAADPLATLAEQRCVPLTTADYALHLAGSHALD